MFYVSTLRSERWRDHDQQIHRSSTLRFTSTKRVRGRFCLDAQRVAVSLEKTSFRVASTNNELANLASRCRLVREHLTFLGLSYLVKPVPRQTLLAEGAYDGVSRFRPEAYEAAKRGHARFRFPLLVDRTDASRNSGGGGGAIVVGESKEIVRRLWSEYGKDVAEPRPETDVILNSSRLPFPVRFGLLAAPSVLRPFPRCGLIRTPSKFDADRDDPLTLYGVEGCAKARLVREVLCTLEIPYSSYPGTSGRVKLVDDNQSFESSCYVEACDYLWATYQAGKIPTWFAKIPDPNLGTSGSFFPSARDAFVAGRSDFIPEDVFPGGK